MQDRIKQVRKSENLTQQEFADRIGTPRANIAGYERGIRTPSEAIISLICREFDISEEWLRNGTGEMRVETTQKQKLARFFADVLSTAPDERSAFVSILVDLPPEFYALVPGLLKKYAAQLMEQAAAEKNEEG